MNPTILMMFICAGILGSFAPISIIIAYWESISKDNLIFITSSLSFIIHFVSWQVVQKYHSWGLKNSKQEQIDKNNIEESKKILERYDKMEDIS